MSSFLVVITLYISVSVAKYHLDGKIVNGVPTTANSYSYIASLNLYHSSLYGWFHFCTGSIVRKEKPATILTAAHCVDDVSWGQGPFGVDLLRTDPYGDYDPTHNAYSFHPSWKIIIHEQFDNIWLTDDIALIFLDESLEDNDNLETVTLASSECDGDVKEALQAIGYGRRVEGGQQTDTVHYTDLICLNDAECDDRLGAYITYVHTQCNNDWNSTCAKSWDPHYQYNHDWPDSLDILDYVDDDKMMCAAGNDTGVCHGDSGGPLVKTGTNVQYGIASWILGGCNRGGISGKNKLICFSYIVQCQIHFFIQRSMD